MIIHESHRVENITGSRYCQRCLSSDKYASTELEKHCFPLYDELGQRIWRTAPLFAL
jgi:hypothetical protein